MWNISVAHLAGLRSLLTDILDLLRRITVKLKYFEWRFAVLAKCLRVLHCPSTVSKICAEKYAAHSAGKRAANARAWLVRGRVCGLWMEQCHQHCPRGDTCPLSLPPRAGPPACVGRAAGSSEGFAVPAELCWCSWHPQPGKPSPAEPAQSPAWQ